MTAPLHAPRGAALALAFVLVAFATSVAACVDAPPQGRVMVSR